MGDALPIDALGGPDTTPVEIGLRAATQAKTADSDLALAIAHRPDLRFDTHETVPKPLDVGAMFERGHMSMCEAGQKLRSLCVALQAGDELRAGFNHLAFDTKAVIDDADIPSRIYFHAVHAPATDDAHPDGLILLDYWWYLPDNPAGSGSGAFCGPGFSIGGATCFDHQSDWEGVTVILDARHPSGAPVAVNYAEHEGSVRYSWAALRRLWAQTKARTDDPVRPVVFSARGTHASYPVGVRSQLVPARRGAGHEGHLGPDRPLPRRGEGTGPGTPTTGARPRASPPCPHGRQALSLAAGAPGAGAGARPTA